MGISRASGLFIVAHQAQQLRCHQHLNGLADVVIAQAGVLADLVVADSRKICMSVPEGQHQHVQLERVKRRRLAEIIHEMPQPLEVRLEVLHVRLRERTPVSVLFNAVLLAAFVARTVGFSMVSFVQI